MNNIRVDNTRTKQVQKLNKIASLPSQKPMARQTVRWKSAENPMCEGPEVPTIVVKEKHTGVKSDSKGGHPPLKIIETEKPNDVNGTKSQQNRSYEQLLRDVAKIKNDEFIEIESIVTETRFLSVLKRDYILKALKKKTGINLESMRYHLKSGGESENRDHHYLAVAALQEIGSENIIYSAACFWKWNNKGVWQEAEDRYVKTFVQKKMKKNLNFVRLYL